MQHVQAIVRRPERAARHRQDPLRGYPGLHLQKDRQGRGRQLHQLLPGEVADLVLDGLFVGADRDILKVDLAGSAPLIRVDEKLFGHVALHSFSFRSYVTVYLFSQVISDLSG